jgi:hypothetical protein
VRNPSWRWRRHIHCLFLNLNGVVYFLILLIFMRYFSLRRGGSLNRRGWWRRCIFLDFVGNTHRILLNSFLRINMNKGWGRWGRTFPGRDIRRRLILFNIGVYRDCISSFIDFIRRKSSCAVVGLFFLLLSNRGWWWGRF